LGNGAILKIAVNFGDSPVAFSGSPGSVLIKASASELNGNDLPPHSAFVWLTA
jgi:hypothetical protein